MIKKPETKTATGAKKLETKGGPKGPRKARRGPAPLGRLPATLRFFVRTMLGVTGESFEDFARSLGLSVEHLRNVLAGRRGVSDEVRKRMDTLVLRANHLEAPTGAEKELETESGARRVLHPIYGRYCMISRYSVNPDGSLLSMGEAPTGAPRCSPKLDKVVLHGQPLPGVTHGWLGALPAQPGSEISRGALPARTVKLRTGAPVQVTVKRSGSDWSPALKRLRYDLVLEISARGRVAAFLALKKHPERCRKHQRQHVETNCAEDRRKCPMEHFFVPPGREACSECARLTAEKPEHRLCYRPSYSVGIRAA